MKIIALTGSTGVIGQRLQNHFKDTQFICFQGDIRNTEDVKRFCKEATIADAFIHLAAIVPKQIVDSDPSEAFDVNVRGTLNVLEGLRQLRHYAPWLFIASTSHVYASSDKPLKESDTLDPFTLYGLTKLQAEEWGKAYIREFKMRICIGRIFSFSDPLQQPLYFIPAMIKRIIEAHPSEELEISGITGQRDFLTVPQICETINLLFEKNYNGIINIGTGKGNYLLDVVKKIAQFAGREDLTIKAKNDSPNYLVADTQKLNQLGGQLTCDLDNLLKKMVQQANKDR